MLSSMLVKCWQAAVYSLLISGYTKQAIVQSREEIYQSKRRDATCPITAEATHTGGGRNRFKPVGKKLKNHWYPSFPWQSPPAK